MSRFFPKVFLKKYSVALLLLFSLIACKNGEKIASTEDKDMSIDPGLISAVIVDYSRKEAGCSFLLELEDKSLLQPMRLPEELKIDGLEVLIKYTPSRRQQGDCLLGTPIIINEINKKP